MIRKIQYNSPVILTFTFLCIFVLILGTVTGGFFTQYVFTNFKTSFYDPMQYIRLFSYILGHANWAHFFNNFLLILLVGPMVEEKYGSKKLLYMILITAFFTGIINIIFFNTALIGASGVAFMLILLSSFANTKSGKIPLTLILVAVAFLGKEVLNAAFAKDNISQAAHILGGLFGAIFGYLKNNKTAGVD